jgi:hypothetical protein
METFITAREYAKATGRPYPTIAYWLQRGLIPGARKGKLGDLVFWQIPADSPAPTIAKGRPKKEKGRATKGPS